MMEQYDNVVGIKLADVPEMKDEKYLVIKRVDLEELLQTLGNNDAPQWFWDEINAFAVQDAVVIRTQDDFAGPALHSYANSIFQVAKAIKESEPELTRQLMSVADYFQDRAREADEVYWDGRTKFPD